MGLMGCNDVRRFLTHITVNNPVGCIAVAGNKVLLWVPT